MMAMQLRPALGTVARSASTWRGTEARIQFEWIGIFAKSLLAIRDTAGGS
jgi:hypothetical protein